MRLSPAFWLNATVARYPIEPSEEAAKIQRSGVFLASATTSAMLFCGRSADMMTSIGASPTRAIGVNSVSGSYGALRITSRAMVWVEAENSSV